MSTLEAAHERSPFVRECSRVTLCRSHADLGILSFPSTFHDTCLCAPGGPGGPSDFEGLYVPGVICNPCYPCSLGLDPCSHREEACHASVEDGPVGAGLPFFVGSSHRRVS